MRPTDIDADVIFLLDSSQSVRREDYRKEKDFVKAMARSLNVSPGKSQIAVIVYGATAQTLVRFSDDSSSSALDNRIDSLPTVGGERRIDTALGKAAAILATARPSSPKIILLLTAGKHVSVGGGQSLADAARSIRALDGRAFAVAVGPEVDVQELREVVEAPSHVFSVPTYDGLHSQVEPISRKIAQDSGMRPFKL